MEEDVLFTIDEDNIARITLNRPQAHNSLDEGMIQKLITHCKALHESTTVRALIIRGNGESFCSGSDLSSMKKPSQLTESQNFDEARLLSQLLYSLDLMPIPTIAFAHGEVRGGGIGLLACSDIVLADPQTNFSFSETRIGLVPSVISPYILRIFGLRQTKRYFLTGETIDASTAYRLGLIHDVVESNHADQEVDKIVGSILAGGPQAVREVKKLMYYMTGDISESIRLRAIELVATLRRSEEFQLGIEAFFEKSIPAWVPNGHGKD